MRKMCFILFFVSLCFNVLGQQSHVTISDTVYQGEYLGLNFPDTIPEVELCHIYISHKKDDGEWSKPVDLSLKMNFNDSSKFPYVSPDGKFLFFSSGENIY